MRLEVGVSTECGQVMRTNEYYMEWPKKYNVNFVQTMTLAFMCFGSGFVWLQMPILSGGLSSQFRHNRLSLRDFA